MMFDPTIADRLAREIADGQANPAKVLAFRLSDAPEAVMQRKAREIMGRDD